MSRLGFFLHSKFSEQFPHEFGPAQLHDRNCYIEQMMPVDTESSSLLFEIKASINLIKNNPWLS